MEASLLYDRRTLDGLRGAVRREVDRLGRPLRIMEVCGTHTHAIAESGLRRALRPGVRLVSGPGCPVCVTPVSFLDRAEALARQRGAILCTFGDLFRVPSSSGSLERLRAEGADVRILYSPRDALAVAEAEPGRPVVFLGVGFETTAPTVAAALEEARSLHLENFSLLSGHKTMPEALRVLAGDPGLQLDGFLLPGHVSVVTGAGAFAFLGRDYGLPSAVVGFTPADILRGVWEIARQRAGGEARTVNLYGRVVTEEGNLRARALLERLFVPCDSEWRGLGPIPGSGLALSEEAARHDAALLPVEVPPPREPGGCRCGEVLKGALEPPGCPLFGESCTPDLPVGACMVSSEGTCAAWYRHERWRLEGAP